MLDTTDGQLNLDRSCWTDSGNRFHFGEAQKLNRLPLSRWEASGGHIWVIFLCALPWIETPVIPTSSESHPSTHLVSCFEKQNIVSFSPFDSFIWTWSAVCVSAKHSHLQNCASAWLVCVFAAATAMTSCSNRLLRILALLCKPGDENLCVTISRLHIASQLLTQTVSTWNKMSFTFSHRNCRRWPQQSRVWRISF